MGCSMAGKLGSNCFWEIQDFFVLGLWPKDFPMALLKLPQTTGQSVDTPPSLLSEPLAL